MINSRGNGLVYLGALSAVCIFIVLPFFYPINGHDGWIHLNWLDQFTQEFRNADFYPRWMPNSFYGYGSSSFYFYPPLTYWVSSIFSYLTTDPATLYYLVTSISVFISGICFYKYVTFIGFNKKPSQVASLLFVLSSYRIIDVYLRNAFTEQFAILFIPLILLSIEYLARADKQYYYKAILLGSCSWAALALTNIPTTVIMIYCTLIYAPIRLGLSRRLSIVLLQGVIGVLLAALYIIPSYELQEFIKTEHLWLVVRSLGFRFEILTDFDDHRGIVFNSVIIIHLILGSACAFVIGAYIRKESSKHTKNIAMSLLGIILFVLAIQLASSKELLDFLPLMKYIQLTFRLDILLVFALPVTYLIFENKKPVLAQYFAVILISFAIATALGGFQTIKDNPTVDILSRGNADVPEYVTTFAANTPQDIQDMFEIFAEDSEVTFEIVSGDEGHSIKVIERNATQTRFSVSSIDTVTIIIKRQFFPLWKLHNEAGQEYMLTTDKTARMYAKLSPGVHNYTLSLKKSSAERTGEIISLLTLAGVVVLFIFERRFKASSQSQ